jgi:hypothetical protein
LHESGKLVDISNIADRSRSSCFVSAGIAYVHADFGRPSANLNAFGSTVGITSTSTPTSSGSSSICISRNRDCIDLAR